MKHHALIITKEFESQFTPLLAADLEVLAESVHDINALGFYNAGKEAGPSQPHRHLQVVPREENELPFVNLIDSRIESVSTSGQLIVEEFSFKHAILKISPNDRLLDLYHECLRRCDISIPKSTSEEVKAHNILMGRKWIMVIPRSSADFEEISGNGLNFTGSFFVKSLASVEKIERVGAWNILKFLGYPAPSAKV
jgi:ATP adenylyltransferase